MNSYQKRDLLLKRIGFSSYGAYLSSKLWAGIRKKVLARCGSTCEVCGSRPATEVHHRSYGIGAMIGKRLEFLVASCRTCHESAEFDGPRKTRHFEANSRMNSAARLNGKSLVGLCNICRCNPVRKGRAICGRCKREGRSE